MKKLFIVLVMLSVLASASSASIIVQTQANTMGKGVGLGLSMSVIPMLLDLGIEGNTASSPWEYFDKGSYIDDTTKAKVNYEGWLTLSGARYGVFAKLNLILVTPIIHAGTQKGTIAIDGDLRVPGQGGSYSDNADVYGSYVSIGIPFYIGPVFTEISAGTQSLYVPHFVDVPSVTDVQISFGLSFL